MTSGSFGKSDDSRLQQVVQAGGVDGPAHGGALAGRLVEGDPVGGRPGAVRAVAVAVGGVGAAAVGLGDDRGRVVVDAEEVERLVDLLQVAVLHEGPVGQAAWCP